MTGSGIIIIEVPLGVCEVETEPLARLATMENSLLRILRDLAPPLATKSLSLDRRSIIVQIFYHTQDEKDSLLKKLHLVGIGRRGDTEIRIISTPLTVYTNPKGNQARLENEYLDSMHEIIEKIKTKADLSFNYLALTIIASMMTAMGLICNSIAVIVGGMLVSSLMTPIMAVTLGWRTRDHNLTKFGLRSLGVGMLLCCGVGFGFAFLLGSWDAEQMHSIGEWPSLKMIKRSRINEFFLDFVVSVGSGCAVALSLLESNVESLVGIAIGVSIVPPSVNAGLNWGMSLVSYFVSLTQDYVTIRRNDKDYYNKPRLIPPDMYDPLHSDNMAKEYLVLGTISICNSIICIICTILAAFIMLEVKELTPYFRDDRVKLWRAQVETARAYNDKLRIGPRRSASLSKDYFPHPEDIMDETEKVTVVPMYAGEVPSDTIVAPPESKFGFCVLS